MDEEKKPKRKHGARSREKGPQWEREAATRLRPLFPMAKRGIQTQAHQYLGKKVPDVIETPFWIECEWAKRPGIARKVNQAVSDSSEMEDERPILVLTKEDNCEPLATMFMDDFLKVLEVTYASGRIDETLRNVPNPATAPPGYRTGLLRALESLRLVTGELQKLHDRAAVEAVGEFNKRQLPLKTGGE